MIQIAEKGTHIGFEDFWGFLCHQGIYVALRLGNTHLPADDLGNGGKLLGFSIQLLGVISLVPIALYSGKKITDQKWIQWGFYLFYPVHLALLYIIQEVIL